MDLNSGICSGLIRVPRQYAMEGTARFFLNGGDDALSRDVSNADDEPVDHGLEDIAGRRSAPGLWRRLQTLRSNSECRSR